MRREKKKKRNQEPRKRKCTWSFGNGGNGGNGGVHKDMIHFMIS
jgi:hypothetical protein